MSQAAASPTDEAVAAALRWLSQDDYAARHNQILSERVPGVSEDLVSSAQFQQWLNGEQQALICNGMLKTSEWETKTAYYSNTIVASMVVDTLFEKFGSDLNIGIAFVYPDFVQENQNPEKLLRSMLLQLGQRSPSPSVRSTLVDLHHRSKNNISPPSIEDLLDALGAVVSKMSKVYMVIASLDDLSGADKHKLLQGLQRVHNCLQISLLATSNTGVDDFHQFNRLSTIDTFDAVAGYDLDKYVRRRFSNLPSPRSKDLKLMRDYQDNIRESTNGMFIPTEALMDRLTTMQDFYDRLGFIRGLSSVNDAYGWMMSSIEKQIAEDQHRAKMALSWILFARRPLKEAELRTAVGIGANSSGMDKSNVPDAASIIASCKGFVKITKVPVTEWSLVHSSAAEYLRQTIHEWNPNASSVIAECCLAYLGSDVFGKDHCKTGEDLDSRLRDYPFYEYAAQQWPNHLRGITTLSEGAIRLFFLDQNKVSSANQVMSLSEMTSRQPGYSQVFDRRQTGLHLAARFGLTQVVNFLLTEKKDKASKDSLGRTPLWFATEGSHEETMRVLSRGDRITFTLMLNKKASSLAYSLCKVAGNIIKDSRSRTALHIGVIQSDLDLIRHALQCGVKINARDADGHSAIQLAFQKRETSAINLLLEKSASTKGVTVASWLKAHGRPSLDIVQLSEDEQGQKKVVFLAAKDFTVDCRLAIPNKRRLCVVPDVAAWPVNDIVDPPDILLGPIHWSKHLPPADEYTLCYSMLASTPISNGILSGKVFEYKLKTVRIAWTLTLSPDTSGRDQWTAVDYLSTLADGSIPDSGAAFFSCLVKTLIATWLELCDNIDMHLIMCRPDVLNANGDQPELIRRLLEDANTWHILRHLLHIQVKTARRFRDEYIKLVGKDVADESLVHSLDRFEHDIGLRIDKFDNVSTTLIQLEFNLTSIREAQRSTSINRSMKRLSWITFIYLPLIFVSGLFGMNVDLLESNPSWKWYAVFMVCTLSLTMIIWVIFKRFPGLEDWLEDKMSWLVEPSKFRAKNSDTERGLSFGNKEKTV